MKKRVPLSLHLRMKLGILPAILLFVFTSLGAQDLVLHKDGYFEMPGLLVTVFNDRYPEGHQGAITIIQNGTRVATNGDLRLEPSPGQWQPIPGIGEVTLDRERKEVTVRCMYPDSSILAKGFNPVFYPDLYFHYRVRVRAEGKRIRVNVDLEEPLPEEWVEKVGFNLELFPGDLFGKTWYLDGQSGLFHPQPNGPMARDAEGNWQAFPMATGKRLTVAPDAEDQRMIIESKGEELQLLDGRFYHNNGWFVVRSAVSPGKTENAVEWVIEAHAREGFQSSPAVHINQVGYLPGQEKTAVIECDRSDTAVQYATLVRYSVDGVEETVIRALPVPWGPYLQYYYYRFDFSGVTAGGIYRVRYGESLSDPFRIAADLYERHVWQPTLEYFLPVQMCHMRVNEGYRVWHGLCHRDDALMAPLNHNHFDGYIHGPSTLTTFRPGEHVPGLDRGGWHDAGDYDLRVESQAGTVWVLALAYELFGSDWDLTTIDQARGIVEIHRPDGKPDILQQVEHGLLTILGGYQNLGRLYRGIICPTLRQYVLLGDGSTMTDGRVYDPARDTLFGETPSGQKLDDRWEYTDRDDRLVFTEENANRELAVAEALAVAARVMRGYNDTLALQSLAAAEALYAGVGREALELLRKEHERSVSGLYGYYVDSRRYERTYTAKVRAAAELLVTTGNASYGEEILSLMEESEELNSDVVAYTGKVLPLIGNSELTRRVTGAAMDYRAEAEELANESPYGVPFPHRIGSSWGLQTLAMKHYHLYRAFPDLFDGQEVFRALNTVLGCHPGDNPASFVSGVGSRSATVAYGVNRADGSFVPGGTIKGTMLLAPGIPELKIWPFFWQETEYVLDAQDTGGAVHFMFLVMAVQDILQKP